MIEPRLDQGEFRPATHLRPGHPPKLDRHRDIQAHQHSEVPV